MTTAANILSGVEYRVWKDGTTFATTSEPSLASAYQWMNEDLKALAMTCAQENSELGRTTGSITTVTGTITAATKANPCQLTVATHGLSSNDEVLVTDVVGMTELNGQEVTVTVVDANNFTIGIDSSSYTTYSSGGEISKTKYTLSSTLMAPAQRGWVSKTTERNPIGLKTEDSLTDYSPTDTNEPDVFYLTDGNLVSFLPRPDDAYTIKIPYWAWPTAISDTTDTIPFHGVFDNLLIESMTMRIQNRDEFDLSFELKMYSFLRAEATKIIRMRKGLHSEVVRG